jgi:hypothetical protein
MSIVLVGSTSGSITLQEPAVAGTTVLDLPAVSGTILTTASSGQSIPKAALPTGSVLQVVQISYTTGVTTTSTSFVDTGLSLSITPTSATSKIAVIIGQTLSPITSGTSTFGAWRVLRGANVIYSDNRIDMVTRFAHGTYTCALLDSPATTSSTTYKTQMHTGDGSYALEAQHADLRTSTIILMEIAA